MNYPAKIPAFSILETVIAMLLIMLVVGLSTSLFVSVGKNSLERKITIESELQQMANETITNRIFFDEEFTKESYWVEQKIVEYENNEKLYQLQLTAYELETNKKITSWNQLLIIE